MPELKEIHIINTLWGEDYAELFLDTCLPSTLLSGNLPYLINKYKITYKIFTDTATKETIQKHSNIEALSNICEVQIFAYDFLKVLNKYQRMTQYYSFGFQEANRKNAGIIILSPDALLANNAFKTLHSYINQGKNTVFVSGIRVTKETFCQDLSKSFQSIEMLEKACSSRNLMNFVFKHLHPFAKASIWNNSKITSWPSSLYWKIDKNCLCNRASHLHPLFVWPKNKVPLLDGTYDVDFAYKSCPDIQSWKVIDDSDEILIVEISSKNALSSTTMQATPFNVAKWFTVNVHSPYYGLYLLQHKIFFHSKELKLKGRGKNISESDQFFEILKKKLTTSQQKNHPSQLNNVLSVIVICCKYLLYIFPPIILALLHRMFFSIALNSRAKSILRRILPPFLSQLSRKLYDQIKVPKSHIINIQSSIIKNYKSKKLIIQAFFFFIPSFFFIFYRFLKQKKK